MMTLALLKEGVSSNSQNGLFFLHFKQLYNLTSCFIFLYIFLFFPLKSTHLSFLLLIKKNESLPYPRLYSLSVLVPVARSLHFSGKPLSGPFSHNLHVCLQALKLSILELPFATFSIERTIFWIAWFFSLVL